MGFLKCEKCGRMRPDTMAKCPFCGEVAENVVAEPEGDLNAVVDDFFELHGDELSKESIAKVRENCSSIISKASDFEVGKKALEEYLDSVQFDYFFKDSYFSRERIRTWYDRFSGTGFVTDILHKERIGPNTIVTFPSESKGLTSGYDHNHSYDINNPVSLLENLRVRKMVFPDNFVIDGTVFCDVVVDAIEAKGLAFSDRFTGKVGSFAQGLYLKECVIDGYNSKLSPIGAVVKKLIVRNVNGLDAEAVNCFECEDVYVENGNLGQPIKAKRYFYDKLSNYLRDSKVLFEHRDGLCRSLEIAFQKNDLLDEASNTIRIPNGFPFLYFHDGLNGCFPTKPNLIVGGEVDVFGDWHGWFGKLEFESKPRRINAFGCADAILIEDKLICAREPHPLGSGPFIAYVDNIEDLYVFDDEWCFSKIFVGGQELGTVFDCPDFKFPEGRTLPSPTHWKKAVIHPGNCGPVAPIINCEEIVLAEGMEGIALKTDEELGAIPYKAVAELIWGRGWPFGWNVNGSFAPRDFDAGIHDVRTLSLPASFKMSVTEVLDYFGFLENLEINTRMWWPSEEKCIGTIGIPAYGSGYNRLKTLSIKGPIFGRIGVYITYSRFLSSEEANEVDRVIKSEKDYYDKELWTKGYSEPLKAYKRRQETPASPKFTNLTIYAGGQVYAVDWKKEIYIDEDGIHNVK